MKDVRYALSALIKGALSALCFLLAAAVVLWIFGIKTEFRWTAGDPDKNIISVAGDGSGNTDINIADKNIRIKQSYIESFTDRLAELLK